MRLATILVVALALPLTAWRPRNPGPAGGGTADRQ